MKNFPAYILSLVALVSIAACSSNSNQPDVDTSLINKTATPEEMPTSDTAAPYTSNSTFTPADNNNTVTPAPNNAGMPSTPSMLPQNNSVPPAPVKTGSSVALNPPHGQPGHDCAVEVGAPLTGKPTMPSSQSIQPQMPSVLTTPQQPLPNSNSGSSARLNPPHGQPGHDCAVAVGQPLQ